MLGGLSKTTGMLRVGTLTVSFFYYILEQGGLYDP